MENTTCKLNGVKYLSVEAIVSNKSDIERLDNQCKRYGCIKQSIVKIESGYGYSNGYVIVKILVPEKNVIAWSNDN